MFPDIRFEYKWVDEDFGYNTGKAEFRGGKTLSYFTPEGGSAEALELAASILDIDLAEAGYLYNESTGESWNTLISWNQMKNSLKRQGCSTSSLPPIIS
ncbi:hypothetical protein [Thermanaerosceptrum fracticalcis]|uniref:DUF1281 family ferredoxin-like fold protein n=1 Tax=Thermanaerosceptrum fracticalcis TaxID=1712410 RepID=UPI000ABF8196|nr:hypothetical protein [Thermanaerosceptrum fracticalcis]